MSGCSSGCAGVATRGQGAGSSSRQSATMYLVRQGGKPLLTVRLGGLRGWLGRWLGGSPAGWLEPRQGQGRGCGSGRRLVTGSGVCRETTRTGRPRLVRAVLYPSIHLSIYQGQGRPTAVLAADGAPLHKVLAPIWLVDLLEHRVVRRVPARGARPGRGLRLQLQPWLGRGLGRYRRWGEGGGDTDGAAHSRRIWSAQERLPGRFAASHSRGARARSSQPTTTPRAPVSV